jgi:hypothetical protein
MPRKIALAVTPLKCMAGLKFKAHMPKISQGTGVPGSVTRLIIKAVAFVLSVWSTGLSQWGLLVVLWLDTSGSVANPT